MKYFTASMLGLTVIFSAFSANAAVETISFPNILAVNSFQEFLNLLILYLQGIIAFIAILFIVIGGIIYVISGGSDARIKTAKNMWTGAIIGLALALLAPTFLKEIKSIVLGNGPAPTNFEEIISVKQIILNILNFLLSILGILTIITLVISGITYISAMGNTTRADSAKAMIKWSIIGLTVAGSAMILVREITNLITQ